MGKCEHSYHVNAHVVPMQDVNILNVQVVCKKCQARFTINGSEVVALTFKEVEIDTQDGESLYPV